MIRTLAALIVVGVSLWGDFAFAQIGTGSDVTQVEAKEILSLHNNARRAVGVEPLEWSPTLAAFAQEWADELARNGKFEHRPKDGEWAQKHGENIAYGFGKMAGVQSAMRSFLSERTFFVPGTPIPDPGTPFKWGHYSAIVWKSTTHVGAGKAVMQTGPLAGATIYVCNYDPRGNKVGEKPY